MDAAATHGFSPQDMFQVLQRWLPFWSGKKQNETLEHANCMKTLKVQLNDTSVHSANLVRESSSTISFSATSASSEYSCTPTNYCDSIVFYFPPDPPVATRDAAEYPGTTLRTVRTSAESPTFATDSTGTARKLKLSPANEAQA